MYFPAAQKTSLPTRPRSSLILLASTSQNPRPRAATSSPCAPSSASIRPCRSPPAWSPPADVWSFSLANHKSPVPSRSLLTSAGRIPSLFPYRQHACCSSASGLSEVPPRQGIDSVNSGIWQPNYEARIARSGKYKPSETHLWEVVKNQVVPRLLTTLHQNFKGTMSGSTYTVKVDRTSRRSPDRHGSR